MYVDNTTVSPRTNPVPVNTGATSALNGRVVIDFRCGAASCVALTADNNLVAWGNNVYNQIGDGSTTNRPLPVLVSKGQIGNRNITALEAGLYHTAVLTDKYIYSWGSNNWGQLGDNTGLSICMFL